MKRGFTAVELIIMLTVMAILLTLGTVSLRSTLANGRDSERASDIASISRGLEQYYVNGNPKQFSYETKNTYPGAYEMNFMTGNCANIGTASTYSPSTCSEDYLTSALPGVSVSILTPPNFTSNQLLTSYGQPERSPVTIMNDYESAQLDLGKYIYKPMARGSYALCNTACTQYALLYKNESTGAIITIKSKHQ